MSKSLTGENIWNALQAEDEFLASVPEPGRQVWKELCLVSCPIIEPYADLPLTASNFISAKCAVLHLLVEGKWMQKILMAYPDEAFVGGKDLMVEMAGGLLEDLLSQIVAVVAEDPDRWLASLDVTEEQFLMDPRAGRLTLDTAIKWRAGGFTIGDLATTQPSAFFRNE